MCGVLLSLGFFLASPAVLALEMLARTPPEVPGVTISECGSHLIKNFEGLRTVKYKDAAGVWTIGYGHTHGPTGNVDHPHPDWDTLLRQDLARLERQLNAAILVPATQNQYDALCSLAYNIGVNAFRWSTLLRLVNVSKFTQAAEQFDRWVKADSKTLPGLVKRRAQERTLFEKE